MRWDRFFEDLEDQLDSEWEAERAALDTEAERLRVARLTLTERWAALAAEPEVGVELSGGETVTGRIAALGADWIALVATDARSGAAVVPASAVRAVVAPHAAVLRSARGASPTRLQERMTFGFVLRDLVRRRVPVRIDTVDARPLTGTIDRAAADHLDLALHDSGTPRRSGLVTGHRIIPFAAVACVRMDAADAPA